MLQCRLLCLLYREDVGAGVKLQCHRLFMDFSLIDAVSLCGEFEWLSWQMRLGFCVYREVSNRSLCHIDANGCHAACFLRSIPVFTYFFSVVHISADSCATKDQCSAHMGSNDVHVHSCSLKVVPFIEEIRANPEPSTALFDPLLIMTTGKRLNLGFSTITSSHFLT